MGHWQAAGLLRASALLFPTGVPIAIGVAVLAPSSGAPLLRSRTRY
ncbi:MAG: hypothetical protein ACJ8CR_15320 [Roseiflexaceae bacterium]